MARVRKRGKRYQLDYRMDGKRRRLDIDTRAEADELCEKYNALKRADKVKEFTSLLNARQALVEAEIKLTGKTFGEAMGEYAKTCSALKSKQTQKNERAYFKALFGFLVGEKDVHYLREVTPQMLQEYQGRLLAKNSPSTSNRQFNTFKNFFNNCVEWGYLEKSPARYVRHKKESPTPRKTFTDDEIEAVAKELPYYVRRAFLFCALAGVRPGECVSPRVMDWSSETETLIVYSGKGAQSSRAVPLSESASRIVREVLSERLRLKPNDFIFLNSKGKQLKTGVITKKVRAAVETLDLEPGKTPYGLRHTYATKLARMNISQEKTKKLMGHASGRTTEKYYKLEQQDLRETVKDVAKVFDFDTGKEIETVTKSHRIG